MNIAYVCTDPGVPVFGQKGASIHVREVIHALTQLGHNVTLFARSMGGHTPSGFEHIRVIPLDPCPKCDSIAREQWLLDSNAEIRSRLIAHPGVDMIYERHALWADAPMLVAKELGIPGMLEVNSPLVKEQATHRVLHNETDAMACVRRSFQHASAVIAVSADVALFVRAEGASNVHIVPNGVDVQRFYPSVAAARLPSHTNSGHQVIGFVGTLKPWHGVELLLEAFALLAPRMSNATLLIVGDGPLLVPLRARAIALNIAEKVVFTGAVRSDEVPSFVRAMDVAVAPYPQSSDSYFSPLKLYEYMACGRAIVASRIGQIPDVISHAVNGLLCEPGSVSSLRDTLQQVLCDPLLRTNLGLAARSQAEQQHSWASVAKRILTIAESTKGAGVCAS